MQDTGKTPVQTRRVDVVLPVRVIERLDLFAGATDRSRASAIRYAVMRLLDDYRAGGGFSDG